MSHRFGPYISLGVGRWLTDRLAIQISGGYAAGSWQETVTAADEAAGRPSYSYYSKVQQAFGRVEAVTPLYTTIDDVNDLGGEFSLNLLGGYEFGKQWKYLGNSVDMQQDLSYGGLTGALQFKFHSVEGKSLYVQPRVSFVNYEQSAYAPFNGYSEAENDVRYSLAMGVEFGSGARKVSAATDADSEEFSPELYLSAAAGTNYKIGRASCRERV